MTSPENRTPPRPLPHFKDSYAVMMMTTTMMMMMFPIQNFSASTDVLFVTLSSGSVFFLSCKRKLRICSTEPASFKQVHDNVDRINITVIYLLLVNLDPVITTNLRIPLPLIGTVCCCYEICFPWKRTTNKQCCARNNDVNTFQLTKMSEFPAI